MLMVMRQTRPHGQRRLLNNSRRQRILNPSRQFNQRHHDDAVKHEKISSRNQANVRYLPPLGNISPSKESSYVMQQNPACPNCGQAMTLRRTTVNASPAEDDNVFQCPSCKLVYLTPDHVPASGPPAK